jgi:hypothetical protein
VFIDELLTLGVHQNVLAARTMIIVQKRKQPGHAFQLERHAIRDHSIICGPRKRFRQAFRNHIIDLPCDNTRETMSFVPIMARARDQANRQLPI